MAHPHRTHVLLGTLALLAAHSLAPGQDSSGSASGGWRPERVEKGVVLLVEFPDVSHSIDRDFVQMRFSRQLNGYVQEMSYNRVSLDVYVTERWYVLPSPVTRYKISPRNLEVDKARVRKLIDDALRAADKEVDFSKYSFVAIFLGAQQAEYGMIGLCGYPGMLGWSSQDIPRTTRGQPIHGGVAIFCYPAHLGTLFHDIAHILGGIQEGMRRVPCLYDHDLQARPGPLRETFLGAMINMGFWDPMSCHFIERGVAPPGLCSWTRMRLHWMDPEKIKVVRPGRSTEVLLGPLEEGSSETLVIKIPVSGSTYYLVENRQAIGCDRVLPGRGVLILYADDRIPECRHGRSPVRLMDADPSIPHLEGAAFDIGKRGAFRDDRNRISIRLKEKIGDSYRVLITP